MPYNKQKECTRCEASYIPNSNSQKYCKECAPKAYNDIRRSWDEAHPEKKKADQIIWSAQDRQANPDKNRERCARWYRANPEYQILRY